MKWIWSWRDLFQKVVTEKKQIIRLVLDSVGESACGVGLLRSDRADRGTD